MQTANAIGDVEIEVQALGSGYRVLARGPDGTRAETTWQWAVGPQQLRYELSQLERLVVESALQELLDPAQALEELRNFGTRLYQAIFSGDVGTLLAFVRKDWSAVRLRLLLSDPLLLSIPWEFLYDPKRGEFLSQSTRILLVRQLPTDITLPPKPLQTQQPLRILGVVSNPSDLEALQVEAEKARLSASLAQAQQQGRVQLEWLEGATREGLRKALNGGAWTVLHFIGHGEHDPVRNTGLIYLQDESGLSYPMDADSLAQTLVNAPHPPQLVLLNSCKGASQAGQTSLVSTASALLRRGIPAVLAMQYPIGDVAARLFSDAFYQAVFEGQGVDQAVATARNEIFGYPGSLEWATPVLYLRATQTQLTQPAPHPQTRPIQPSRLLKTTTPNRRQALYWMGGTALGVVGLGAWLSLKDRIAPLSGALAYNQPPPRYAPPAVGPWKPLGPGGGGRFSSPAIGAGGAMMAGSDRGGAFLSRDGGQSWRSIGAAEGLKATQVLCCAGLPDGRWLIGALGGLFLSSADGSRVTTVWDDQSPDAEPYPYVITLGVSAQPRTLYAVVHPAWNARGGYLIRSDEGGRGWRKAGDLPGELRVLGLRTHPRDPNTLVIVSGASNDENIKGPAQAWRSRDGGASWQRLGANLGAVYDVAYVRGRDELLLTTLEGEGGSLYRSTDGSNWSKLAARTGIIVAAESQQVTLLELRGFNRWNPTAGFWRSGDGGRNWQKHGGLEGWSTGWVRSVEEWGVGSSFLSHLHTLAASPDSNTLLWASNRFILGSRDGGKSFATLTTRATGDNRWSSRGADATTPAAVAPSPADPNLVFVGYPDIGLWRSQDRGQSWSYCFMPDLYDEWGGGRFGGTCLSVLTDPRRKEVVWAQLGAGTGEPMFIVRSGDGGQTWNRTSGIPKINPIGGLSLDLRSPTGRRTLWCTAGGKVYRSTDDGQTWGLVLDGRRFRQTWFSGAAVFAASSDGLWRSQRGDPGTWQKVALPSQDWTDDLEFYDWNFVGVADMAFVSSTEVWLALTGKGFYRSDDGGQSWELVKADPYARSLSYSARNRQLLIASSLATFSGGYTSNSEGLQSTSDGGKTWAAQNQGLDFPNVLQVRHSQSDNAVWIVAPGQGMLRRG